MLIRHIRGFHLVYRSWNELRPEEQAHISQRRVMRGWAGRSDTYWRFDADAPFEEPDWKWTERAPNDELIELS